MGLCLDVRSSPPSWRQSVILGSAISVCTPADIIGLYSGPSEATVDTSKGYRMIEYKIGGPLKQFTALEKTRAVAEFLSTRMARALESNDAVELHYLLATLDDYHGYLWRYYQNLEKSQAPVREAASD
jgi:hypothetical protein